MFTVYRIWGCIAICRSRKPATALVKGVWWGGVHLPGSGYRDFWRARSSGFPALDDDADQTVFSRVILFSSPCTSTANAVHYAVLWHKRIIITTTTSNVIIVERRRLSSRAWLVSGSRVFGQCVSRNIVILIYYCIYFGRRRPGTADLPR